jgi:hypothetical protein
MLPTNPNKPGWATTEFWLALAGVGAKVVIVLVILGVIPVEKQEGTTRAIVDLLVAIGGIVGITFGSAAYGRQRAEVKKMAMSLQASAEMHRMQQRTQHRPPNQPGVRG